MIRTAAVALRVRVADRRPLRPKRASLGRHQRPECRLSGRVPRPGPKCNPSNRRSRVQRPKYSGSGRGSRRTLRLNRNGKKPDPALAESRRVRL